jgi:D-alanine-D-alanine ligase
MERPTVLLVFGGESSEHDVSVSSARNVYAAIDDAKFDVELCYIDKQGKWWLLDTFAAQVNSVNAPQLVPVLGAKSFITLPNNKVIKPNVILPILHGKNGEDGSVQGLAQLLHIPIVGCDMTASAICMDKVATKEILMTNNVKVVSYETHRVGDANPDFNHLSMRLGSPMFIKPSRAGSSFGVSRVYSEDELAKALVAAHEHDAVALIERGVSGRELEVSVLGNPPNHRISGVCEVKTDQGFYDYEAKYSADSSTEFIIPAALPDGVTEQVRRLAGKVYTALGCTGLARVDFFLTDDGTIYLNEVNTFPGFTNLSVYPKLWRHDGVTYSDLIERLITLALHGTIRSNQTEG